MRVGAEWAGSQHGLPKVVTGTAKPRKKHELASFFWGRAEAKRPKHEDPEDKQHKTAHRRLGATSVSK